METDRSRVCILLFSVLFRPLKKDSGTYIDGGLLNNYPLNRCIDNAAKQDDESDSILGISISSLSLTAGDGDVKPILALFLRILLELLIEWLINVTPLKPIKNEIIVKAKLGDG
jgi:predicted acylesterase/phospholipase RssA